MPASSPSPMDQTDPLLSLHEIRFAELTERLAVKYGQLRTTESRCDGDPTNVDHQVTRRRLREEIQEITDELDDLRARLHHSSPLRGEPPMTELFSARDVIEPTPFIGEPVSFHNRPTPIPRESAETAFSRVTSVSAAVPQHLAPMFKGDVDDPQLFISTYEARIRTALVPESRWAPLLAHYVAPSLVPWVLDAIVEPELPWPAAKEAFLGHFVTPHLGSLYRQNFNNLKMRPNEEPRAYVDRFEETARLANMDPNGHIEKFVQSLNPPLAMIVGVSCVLFPHATFTQVSRWTLSFSSLPHFTSKLKSASLTDPFKQKKPDPFCSRCNEAHPWGQHKDQQKPQAPAGPSKPSPTTITCYTCKQPGHTANRCPQKPPSSTRLFGASTDALLEEPAPTTASDNANDHPPFDLFFTQTSSCSAVPSPLDPISLPFLVNDSPLAAVVDTGSEKTFISGTTASSLGLDIQPSSIMIRLCSSSPSAHVPVIGSAFITLCYNGRSITTNVLVHSLPSDISMILGRDLMPAFGIGVTGLVLTDPSSDSLPSELSDTQPPFDCVTHGNPPRGPICCLSHSVLSRKL